MSSTTLVPDLSDIRRLYAFISSINHAHYILRLVRCFYICDVVVVKSCTSALRQRHKADSWPCAQIILLYKNASARVVMAKARRVINWC